MSEGVYVTLFCDSGSTSRDLIHAADHVWFVSPWTVFGWIDELMSNQPQEPQKLKLHELPNLVPVKFGQRHNGKRVLAYAYPTGYGVAYPFESDEDKYYEMRHRDLNTAANFSELDIGEISWKSSAD